MSRHLTADSKEKREERERVEWYLRSAEMMMRNITEKREERRERERVE
jgi:hypothetical protein